MVQSMIHKKQQTNFGCVYATLSMILGGEESFYYSAIRKDNKTNGATYLEVIDFLVRYNYDHKLILLKNNIEELFWLPILSKRYPIYVAGIFKHQGKRGRPSERNHAFAVFDGKIYDPSEDFALEFGSCSHYSKLIIDTVIPIFKDNPNYGKNKI